MNKVLFLIAFLWFTDTYAQKLPAVQQVGLRAPATVKIDGKINEWGKLLAYNRATELFYTMANDDKRLYLIIQATNWNTLTNVANGGIKLIIKNKGGKVDTDAPFIKFPYLEKGRRINVAPRGMERGDADTLMMKDNRQLTENVKWIYTKGLDGVDTLLSIYNTAGITAANAFDMEKNYNLEIAVDLSLFGLSVESRSKFSYHILVNAEPNRYTYTGMVSALRSNLIRNMSAFSSNAQQVDLAVASFENQANKSSATTDFWGEYTLVK